MRRILTLATAALTLAGALAVGGPAAAQYRRDWNRNRNGDAVAAGVLGFALGAAVGGSGSRYNGGYYAPRYYGGGYGGYYAPSYGRGYYAPGYGQRYYGRGPAYAYGYQYRNPRRCVVDRQWDPRWGRSVEVRRCW